MLVTGILFLINIIVAGKNGVQLTEETREEMNNAAHATEQTLGVIRANKTGRCYIEEHTICI